jgi:leader peptidase (prepilin peptidase)/N-methyltransferase
VDAIGQVVYLGVLALLGLVFGSFGNVVIWRLPRGESLSSPPSHCPECGSPIRYRDNLPVLSWLLLRGRCRDCGTRISPRYPAVELVSGALFVLAGVLYGVEWQALVAICFFYILLLLTAIDLDTMRLPNTLVIVLASIGGATALISQVSGVPLAPLLLSRSGLLSEPAAAALVGAALGAGLSLGIALLYRAARGRQGLGMGDVKLLGAMGLYLGPYVLMAFFLGSMIGAVWALVAAGRAPEGGAHRVPFGPFLSAGAVLTVAVGAWLWGSYLGVLGVT